MAKYLRHTMHSWQDDPVKSGDMRSWFFFYKWRAGPTSVRAQPGYNDDVQPGDWLLFCMDHLLLAVATVTSVEYCITWGCNEVYFDSDNMLVPKFSTSCGEDSPLDQGAATALPLILVADALPLSGIPEGGEPDWLKSFLTKKLR